VGLVRSPREIEDIVVASTRGTPVFIRDVGRVRIGSAPPSGIFGINGRSGGVEGIAAMRRGENPSEVLKGVREAVEELNSSGLPAGVRIAPIYDRTELVNSTLKTVSRTLLEALAIVFVVLVFLLGSFKAAILTALTIPLSLLFAFLCMNVYGVPANLLSLGALDFGIIVDGTLVMVEFILSRLKQGQGSSNLEIVEGAALEVERPIICSLSILIAAYIPLFTLQRVEQRLFSPMAFTVCAALVGSLLFTVTVVPVLATYLFRGGYRAWSNPLLAWLTRVYVETLRALMKPAWQLPAFVVTTLFIVGSVFVAGKLGSEFLPQLDEGVIWVRAILEIEPGRYRFSACLPFTR
jgi:cobalt-zinc-cadmium resistance protein CzcA